MGKASLDEQDGLNTMQNLFSRVLAEFEGQAVGAVAAELAGSQHLDSAVLPEEHAMTHASHAMLTALDLEPSRATLSDDHT